MKGQLDDFHRRWGDFEWRNDSSPTVSARWRRHAAAGPGRRAAAGDPRFPGQVSRQRVSGGQRRRQRGRLRLRPLCLDDFVQRRRGGHLRNYYASLLLPPDKSSDIPDVWNPNNYDKATWRGLLCINFDMTGDTWDPCQARRAPRVDRHLPLPAPRRGSWGDGCGSIGRSSPATTRRCTSSGSAAIDGGASSSPSGLRRRRHRAAQRAVAGETYTVTFHESQAMRATVGRRFDGAGDRVQSDDARRVDLSESATPSRQQARQGAAHRGERGAEAGGARTWAIRASN